MFILLVRDLLLKICVNLIEFLNKIILSEDFSHDAADHQKISLESGCCLFTR
jgi:hypothetical protein